MALAILSALDEELRAILPLVENARVEPVAGRQFHRGRLAGRDVVLVLSGIGKVAAATTSAVLMDRFACTRLVFTGVAGGLGADVHMGDVVVVRSCLQHDLDASPLFPRWEVPLKGVSRFLADDGLSSVLRRSVDEVLTVPPAGLVSLVGHRRPPRRHEGLIVSGDQFIGSTSQCEALKQALPDALAVEMEGAALAQVCADFGRPLAVLRTISDRADDQAHVDFPRFIQDVASVYARDILVQALAQGL